MRVIIAGGRNYYPTTLQLIAAVKKSGFVITELVCGMCSGVDMSAYTYAIKRKIPVKEFHPDWNKYGKSAGPKRNLLMAEYADALIAFWDGESRGTASMINFAKRIDINIHVVRI